MSRQRTVHLSAKALKSIRPSDGLSPRINQIIERYQAIIDAARSNDAGTTLTIIDRLAKLEASEDQADRISAAAITRPL